MNQETVSQPRLYSGGAFAANTGAGRRSGTLGFKNSRLIFLSEEQTVELPLSDLKIRRGGTSHRQIFFEHPEHPDCSLFTTDLSILNDPALKNRPELADQIGTEKKKTWGRRGVTLALLILLVALIPGSWLLKGLLVRVAANHVPQSWENGLGEQLFAGLKSGGSIIDDEQARALLLAMAAPLLKAAEGRGTFHLHLARDPAINAFAMPGGYVVVNSGLIDAAEEPEEVLGVLGHELAHVTERHVVRGILDQLGTRLLIGLALGGTDIPTDAIDLGAQTLVLTYSRSQEQEADEEGLALLKQAGIHPRGLVKFFSKLKAQHGGLEGPEFLSTHPATDDRIRNLESKISGLADLPPQNPEPLIKLKQLLSSSSFKGGKPDADAH